MIEAIVFRLEQDEDVRRLLSPYQTDEDNRISPESIEGMKPGIVYNYNHLTFDIPRFSRLEVTAGSGDFDFTRELQEAIIKALHIEDEQKGYWHEGINIMACKLNGGGILNYDTVSLYQKIAVFDVKWKGNYHGG